MQDVHTEFWQLCRVYAQVNRTGEYQDFGDDTIESFISANRFVWGPELCQEMLFTDQSWKITSALAIFTQLMLSQFTHVGTTSSVHVK